MSKLFTFFIGNRIHTFEITNYYIERNLQGEFWTKLYDSLY